MNGSALRGGKIISIFVILPLMMMQQSRISCFIVVGLLSFTIPSFGQDNSFVPASVLNKFNVTHPKATDVEWSYGRGEPIEHNLLSGYFKGRTYFNVDFTEGQSVHI